MGYNPMAPAPPPPPKPRFRSSFSTDDHFGLVNDHIDEVVRKRIAAHVQLGAQQQEALHLLDRRDKEIQDRIIALENHVQELIDIIAYMQKEIGITSNASISSVLDDRRKQMMDSLLGVDSPSTPPIAEDSDDRRKRMQEKIRGTR